MHRLHPETLAIHAGLSADLSHGARALPIYQSSSFVLDSLARAGELFDVLGADQGHVYSRVSNPTVAVFEDRVAALEGGSGAVATASGMAAESMALLTLLQAGDHVVAAGELYGTTVTLLAASLSKFGIETSFVDARQPEAVAAAMRANTRAVFAESLSNPGLCVLDIAAVAEVAHAHGVPLIVDNTVATPVLCNPLALGADVVVHSATKYLSGHGTALGGAVVEAGGFPWDNGNFPGMTEPSVGCQEVRFFETFGERAFAARCRMEGLRVHGAVLSPMNAWQILQGMETLPLRMRQHSANALQVAEFLRVHPAVSWVNYPGLADHPQHALLQRQMSGASGLLTFGLKGGKAAAAELIDRSLLMSHVVNIGDTRTLINHPASTTHRQLNTQQQSMAGVSEDMLRLSVGIEHIDDILWDMDQALSSTTLG